MKHLYKSILVLCAAVIILCSAIPAFSAEKVVAEESTETVVSVNEDGEKAYDLVWKYKIQDGHLYKRRWNNTLNGWYDPAWILVY